MGDRIDLDAIRERHARMDWFVQTTGLFDGEESHPDRGALLAEVDRLTAENDVLRTEIANITANKREQP